MKKNSSSKLERFILGLFLLLLFIDLFFTNFLPGSINEIRRGTPMNVIVFSMIFMLFLWRSGVIISKGPSIGGVINIDVMENDKNKKRVDTLFYVWYFFVFIVFVVGNFFPTNNALFYRNYLIYFQILGFIALIFVVYMLRKSLKKTKEFRESIKNK